MDEDRILKKIEDSAMEIEVPKSLEPEEIRKKLEAAHRQEKPEKVLRFRKYAGWAAAAAVLLAAGVAMQPLQRAQNEAARGQVTEAAAESEKAEAAADTTAAAPKNAEGAPEAAADTTAAAPEKAEAAPVQKQADPASNIRRVSSYEELYQIVKDYEERSAVQEDVVFDTGMVSEEMVEAAEESVTINTYGTAADYDIAGISADTAQEKGSSADTAENKSSGTGYSETNVQEKGVAEADIVKTDGTYIYALGREEIRIVDAGNMELTASVPLGNPGNAEAVEMYVDKDLLQVVACGFEYVSVNKTIPLSDGTKVQSLYEIPIQMTTVTTYDISDKSSPKETDTYRQDGRYLTSRKNGEYLYLFTSYSPKTGENSGEQQYYFVPEAGDGVIPCEEIYLLSSEEEAYTGNDYLVAGSVKNGDASRAADRMAVVNGGGTFYVSGKNIYAAADLWADDGDWTDLVRLGYEDGNFIPGNTSRIPGSLNNNFSMDEYKDYLRVVTTSNGRSAGRSNNLYVLDKGLEITGKIEGLAENEDIQSARFLGDTGYFVTYRNMDPLFSVDLSDPENPQILGELKITGFSEYLHFYGENRLLGIGWETDPDTGEQLGLKCSMFDISNPTEVRETDKLVLGNVGYCRALDNYKEIMVDEEKNIFGFSYVMYQGENWTPYYYYGIFSHESKEGFKALEYLKVSEEMADTFEEYESLRGLYIDNTFFLVGENGLESYDMGKNYSRTGTLYWEEG